MRGEAATPAETFARFERFFNETIAELSRTAGASPIAEQIGWHFGAGGKRLRPRLLLRVARDEGGTFAEAIDSAVALEFLHNSSLVHDDIEDGDEFRRGRRTVWARYGLAHGVNAGDALGAFASLAVLRNSGGLPAERVVHLARVLQRAYLAMCAGQGLDLSFEQAPDVTVDAYLAMIDGKSAALFGAACELGALCGGADERRAAAYGELGRTYGRAFQIWDDVAGTWGTRAQTGKRNAGDIVRRKRTYPVVWALAGPPSAARAEIAEFYARAVAMEPETIDAVAAALDALGARDAAEHAALALLDDAERIARDYGIDRSSVVRDLFAPARTPALA